MGKNGLLMSTEDKDAARMEIGRCVEHLAKGMRLQAQAVQERNRHYTSREESEEKGLV